MQVEPLEEITRNTLDHTIAYIDINVQLLYRKRKAPRAYARGFEFVLSEINTGEAPLRRAPPPSQPGSPPGFEGLASDRYAVSAGCRAWEPNCL